MLDIITGDPIIIEERAGRGSQGDKGDPGGNVMAVGLATDLVPTMTVPTGAQTVRTSGAVRPGVGIADYARVADTGQAASPFVKRTANGVFEIAGSRVTIAQAGVEAGTTDAGDRITSALDYQRNKGGTVVVDAARYQVASRPNITLNTRVFSYGCVYARPGVDMHGDGGTLYTTTTTNILGAYGIETGRTAFTQQPFAPGKTQYAVGADVAAYSVGGWVLWRFGDVVYDRPETTNWGFAKVSAVDAGAQTVTLDRPLAKSWADDGTADTWNHHLVRFDLAEGRVFTGVHRFEGSQGIAVSYERAPYIDTIIARRPGAGAFCAQYAEDFHVRSISVLEHPAKSPEFYSTRIAESSGRIDHLLTRGSANGVIFAESGSDLSVGYLKDTNIATDERILVKVNTSCRVHVDRLVMNGRGGQVSHTIANGSRATFGTVSVETDAPPNRVPCPGYDADRVELRIGDADPENYLTSLGIWFEVTYPIAGPQDNRQYWGPAGVVAEVTAALIGGAVPGDFNFAGWGRISGDGTVTGPVGLLGQESFHQLLVPDNVDKSMRRGGAQPSVIGLFGKNYGGALNWTHRAARTYFNLSTSQTAVAAPGTGIRMRMLVIPNHVIVGANSA